MYIKINQKGLVPLAILIAAGVIILAGGTYAINKKYISFGSLNTKKIEHDTKQAQTRPAKQELSDQVFTFPNATPDPSGELYELGFEITPPSGWINKSADKFDRVRFLSSTKDTEQLHRKTGDSIFSQPAQVAVSVFVIGEQIQGNIGEDEESMKKLATFLIKGDNPTDYQVITQEYLRRDHDYPAIQFEFKSTLQDSVTRHAYGYVIKYGKYVVMVSGISLESAWGKNSEILRQSVDTFKFL